MDPDHVIQGQLEVIDDASITARVKMTLLYHRSTSALILHGDDDQIVPISAAALRSAKLVKNETLKIYAGAPHGLADTHKDQLNADLLAFIKNGGCFAEGLHV